MKKYILLLIALVYCLSSNITYAQKYEHPLTKMESRFVYMTSVSILSGVGELKFGNSKLPNNKNFIFGLHQLLAYQFNPYVITGLGAGVDLWKKTAFIPIYAHLGVNFLDRPFSPHWYVNAGYAFKWYVSSEPERLTRVIHGASTGLQAESGLGVNIRMKDKLSFLILVHYKLQHSEIKYTPKNDPTVVNTNPKLYTTHSQKMFYHFVGLKVGILYW